MNYSALNAFIVAAGLAAIAVPAAHAETSSSEAAEATVLKSAKLTVEDALRAALAKAPGTVSSVQVYDNAGKPAYHVEVVADDGTQQDFSVDGVSGEVMKMAAETGDGERQDDGDRHGEHHGEDNSDGDHD